MFSRLLSTRPKTLNRPNFRARPYLESLEDRQLLSTSPIGAEFLANLNNTPAAVDNDTVAGGPPRVAVASDSNGNFVVVWSSAVSEDGFDFSNIYAQRFDASGTALGSSFQVNESAASGNSDETGSRVALVDVAMNADGDFVIVWTSAVEVDDVLARVYDQDGNAVSDPVQVDNEDGGFGPLQAFRARVAMNDDGTFVVAFEADSFEANSPDRLFVQQFFADGSADGNPLLVSGANPIGEGFGLSGDGNDTFILVWDTTGGQLQATQFANAAGSIVTLTTASGLIGPPDVALAATAGTAVMVWTENNSGTLRVQGLQFTTGLVASGATFTVNQSTIEGGLQPAHVAAAPDGAFRVVWVSGATPSSVTVTTFSAGGALDTADFTVNSFSSHYVPPPSMDTSDVAVDDNGNFVIAFAGYVLDGARRVESIYARIFRNNAVPPPAVVPDATATDLSFLAVSLSQRFESPRNPPFAPLSERVSRGLPPFAIPSFGEFRPLFEETVRTVGGISAVGRISGKVFEDLNGNGVQDPGEPALPGVLVFLDFNKNGRWDDEEPFFLSDVNGDYLFENLLLDRYTVVQDLEKVNVEQTSPPDRQPNVVTLSQGQPQRQEVNFGDKQFSGVKPKPPLVGPIEPKKDTSPRPPSTDPKSPGEAPSKPPKMSENEE